jgi:uncharacterized protein (TIGR00251 family)
MTTTARITVKVAPGASQDKIAGWLGDILKIRVHVQPEKGKANAAVVKLLAASLEIPNRNIRICAGETSRTKVIEVLELSDAELREKLTKLTA